MPDDTQQTDLGRRVASLREAAGLTQADLAQRLHVTQSAISRIESGSRRLSAAQLVQLSEILGIDPGTLYSPSPQQPWTQDLNVRSDRTPSDWMAAPTTPRQHASMSGPADRPGARSDAALPYSADAPPSPAHETIARSLAGPPLPDRQRRTTTLQGAQIQQRPVEPPLFAEVVRDWFEVAAAAPELRPQRPGMIGLDPQLADGGADPVRLARFWRYELGVGERGPLPDLVVLLEAAGVQVVVARLDDDQPHGACIALPGAATQSGGPSDAGDAAPARIPFVFINGQGRPVALQRFALAHEFAHLALGHREAYDERIDWSGRSRREVEANAFAEEFVAPLAAVRHWFEMEGSLTGSTRSEQIGDVETVIRLANHFGVSFWVARYRARSAGLLTSPTRLREIDRELRHREWQTIPRQLFLGGLRDTLSALRAEARPGQEQNALRMAPQGVRVPGPMRAAVLRQLESGSVSLEQAHAWLRIGAADLRYQLGHFGVD